MINVIHFTDGHLISTYEDNTSLDRIQHDIDVNDYEWVTMHNIRNVITITVLPKE